MKITVMLVGPSGSRGPFATHFSGSHAVISTEGVCLDGTWVIRRDRRMKSNRIAGHPWMVEDRQVLTGWANFRVEVDPTS
jgi:hypothetical protein